MLHAAATDGYITNSTSFSVVPMTNTGNGWSSTLKYTYDDNGNIVTIKEGDTLKATYHYDALNQLVREDNAWLNKTIVYTYDLGGNILTVKEYAYTTASSVTSSATKTVTYTYGESNWKDKLTKYNGVEISYDEIGNRTSYNGYTYTWENGRQLAGISGNSNIITYKYNSDGIRTQKTVNGVTTNYILEGSNVVKETNGTDTLWFYYDATGSVVGFELNGTAYFYVKNLQGDIIAITNASGTKVVEYVYDSWGKLISTTGTLASTVGAKNPYRYRSYRYDTETGLYYLNSRYYDPEMKRFINADVFASTGQGILGNNMFVYCMNNPINYSDSSGCFCILATANTVANAASETIDLSFEFLMHWVNGNGEELILDSSSNAATELRASSTMNDKIDSELENYKAGGTATPTGSIKFTNNEPDLWLAVRRANYELSIAEEEKHFAFCSYSYTKTRYIIAVKVFDTYNFNTGNESGDGIGSLLNNIGYWAQEHNLGKEYYWEVTYEITTTYQ